MSRQAERPLWGMVGIVIAVLLLLLTVGALAALSPPPEVPQQPVYARHPLTKISPDLTDGLLGVSFPTMPEEVRIIITLNIWQELQDGEMGAATASADSSQSRPEDVTTGYYQKNIRSFAHR